MTLLQTLLLFGAIICATIGTVRAGNSVEGDGVFAMAICWLLLIVLFVNQLWR